MAEPIYLQIEGHLEVGDGEDRAAAIDQLYADIQGLGLIIDEFEEVK